MDSYIDEPQFDLLGVLETLDGCINYKPGAIELTIMMITDDVTISLATGNLPYASC